MALKAVVTTRSEKNLTENFTLILMAYLSATSILPDWTSNLPSNVSSITSFSRQFLLKTWQIPVPFFLLYVRYPFTPWFYVIPLSFFTRLLQMISILLQYHLPKYSSFYFVNRQCIVYQWLPSTHAQPINKPGISVVVNWFQNGSTS